MTAPPSPDALRLTNGVVDVRIPRTYGPRITHFGFADGPNVLGDGAGVERVTPRGTWRAYGGHRLWAAPEVFPDTYTIDDAPPEIETFERRAVVRRARDPATGLIASMDVELEPGGTRVTVRHAIANDGPSARRLAPWAITVAAPGGTAVIPQPRFAPQPEALLPARTMALWRYTDLSDARFAFGTAFLRLRCDPSSPQPNKIGVACERGWFAYLSGRTAFVIESAYDEAGEYPDRGCSVEVYTQGPFCEVETLAPLVTLPPGGVARHVERWSLVGDVDAVDDGTLDRVLGKHLGE
ncbi:MAG TPA: hypothetical protein VHT53_02035 [Candidatus Elarobacter sp.]|nr:hypothetical protein [Candidatus Elarobacter sp.]